MSKKRRGWENRGVRAAGRPSTDSRRIAISASRARTRSTLEVAGFGVYILGSAGRIIP